MIPKMQTTFGRSESEKVNLAATEQPAPLTSLRSEPVLPLVLSRLSGNAYAILGNDLVERAELGIERYGTPLMTHNGRNALADLYQELLDGLMYLGQYEEETTILYQDFVELTRIAIHVKGRLEQQGATDNAG